MKKGKFTYLLAIILTLALTLAACGGNLDTPSEGSDNENETDGQSGSGGSEQSDPPGSEIGDSDSPPADGDETPDPENPKSPDSGGGAGGSGGAGSANSGDGSSDPGTPVDSAKFADYSQYRDTLLMIVNPGNLLSEDFEPDDLEKIEGSDYRLTAVAAEALGRLLADAKADGIKGLYVASAYRKYSSQQRLYSNKIDQLKGQYGDEAEAVAATIVARPGTSEHQSGLAADVTNMSSLVESFGSTDAGKWLADNSHRYGFVIRYPKGKSEITGIIYEPWHLRYVGLDHAAVMYEEGLCLEEYLALSPEA